MFRRLTHRLFNSPFIRRIQFYARRASGQLDRRFFITLIEGILAIVAIAAVLITLLEKPWTAGLRRLVVLLGSDDGPRPG